MSVSPLRPRARIVTELPRCFRKEACLHSRDSFHQKVSSACRQQGTGTVGMFQKCKVIVVGDRSVGKTSMIKRFCREVFDQNYKITVGVDYEYEMFEVLGIPFCLEFWNTSGEERFKCLVSKYYRNAQAIIVTFDLSNMASLEHTKQWLEHALKENDPSSALLFLVGSKKDLLSPAQYALMEQEAIKVANEMKAEYWAMSSLTGDNVKELLLRVASLTFEASVLAELEG